MYEYLSPPEPTQPCQPRRIGDVLAELLTQYQSRFPHAGVTILETRLETRQFVVEPSAFEAPVASCRRA